MAQLAVVELVVVVVVVAAPWLWAVVSPVVIGLPGGGATTVGGGTGCLGAAVGLCVEVAWSGADEGLFAVRGCCVVDLGAH
eukprot:981355-Amphidinium_carterae.1